MLLFLDMLKTVCIGVLHLNERCRTVSISGYAENGFADDASECFINMKGGGVCPNSGTCVRTMLAWKSKKSALRGVVLTTVCFRVRK